MGSLKGGGKTQTTTENQSTSYPQWTQDANQGLNSIGLNLASPFLSQPRYNLAGFTPDQTKAFDLARQQAMASFTGGGTAVPTGASMTAATSGGAQLGANDFQQFLNPYISNVVDVAQGRARDQLRQTEADIGAKYAAAGAFGGGREALARGKAKSDFDKNLQETTATLLAQGYDNATASAMANAQMRQQTAESNADREQQARSTNLAYGLSAAQLADAMKDSNFARQNTALQQLLGTGTAQQQFGQNALDIPWTNLQRYASLVPNVYNTTQTGTSTQPDNSPGFLQQLLGVGLSVAGLPMAGGGSVGGSLLGKVLK